MSLIDELRSLYEKGLLGHAYLCVGDPLSEGRHFAEEMAVMLLSEGETAEETIKTRHRVDARLHPDVHWVEPRGKLRQIVVEDMQASLKRIHEKSFEGGWKVLIFLSAERLNPNSGNKLLKSLEEPPPRTLILLVSETPEQMLDTLRSRCQTLHLPRMLHADAPWRAPLIELLSMGPPRTLSGRLIRAAQFRDFFDAAAQAQMAVEDALMTEEEEVDDDIENARLSELRRKMQRSVMASVEEWYRDVWVCKQLESDVGLRFPEQQAVLRQQAENLPDKSIQKIIENVRSASRRFEGNLPVQVVLEQFVF